MRAFSAIADEGAGEREVVDAVMWAVWRGAVGIAAASLPFVAARCLEYVQSLPYRPDPPGSDDRVTYPCRTLSVGGDCEDLSILLVSMWAIGGLEARILWITQAGSDQDHVSAQCRLGGRWVWGESTVPGARLGEDPYDAARRLGVRDHGSL